MSRNTIALVAGVVGLCVVVVVVFGGGTALSADLDSPPTLIIEATSLGLSSEETAEQLAVPLERAAAGLTGLHRIESQSDFGGRCVLSITFKEGTDLDAAKSQLRTKVEPALAGLSDEVRKSIEIRDESPAALMVVTLDSPERRIDVGELYDYAEKQLKTLLVQTVGVAAVRTYGRPGSKIDPDLDLIQYRPGEVIKSTAVADAAGFARSGDRPLVALYVYGKSQASRGDVGGAVKKQLEELRAGLPQGMTLDVAFDRTTEVAAMSCFVVEMIASDDYGNGLPHDAATVADMFKREPGFLSPVVLSHCPVECRRFLRNRLYVAIRLTPEQRTVEERLDKLKIVLTAMRYAMGPNKLVYESPARGVRGASSIVRVGVKGPAGTDEKAVERAAGEFASIVSHYRTLLTFDDAPDGRGSVDRITLDPKKAARYGIAPEAFVEAARARMVSNFENQRTKLPTPLSELRLAVDGAEKITVAKVTTTESRNGPAIVRRVDGEPIFELRFGFNPTIAQAEIRKEIEMAAAKQLPPGFSFVWITDRPE